MLIDSTSHYATLIQKSTLLTNCMKIIRRILVLENLMIHEIDLIWLAGDRITKIQSIHPNLTRSDSTSQTFRGYDHHFKIHI